MTVVYEDDLSQADNHQKTADRICEYLGIKSAPVKARLSRTLTDKISDFIENHEEVVQALEKEGYAKYI